MDSETGFYTSIKTEDNYGLIEDLMEPQYFFHDRHLLFPAISQTDQLKFTNFLMMNL